MIIIGVHSGSHDACAAIFDDYRMIGAVALERLSRVKVEGGRVPVEAIDECIEIAGVERKDVGALLLGRGVFDARFFRNMPLGWNVERAVRHWAGRDKPKTMERELIARKSVDDLRYFDAPAFLDWLDLPRDIPVRFYNHHEAHALAPLFHTDWDEALLYTADAGGDNVQYSLRSFKDGRIECLFGGDEEMLRPRRIDSVGLAYAYATQALGWKPARHEGKLTGLSAWGEPVVLDRINERFRIDEAGQVHSDFKDFRRMKAFFFDLFEGLSREDVSASIQKFLEETVLESVRRILERTSNRRLALAGGIFANVRLNQRLAEEMPVDEVFIYPAMSDQGLAAGGVMKYLLERDGLETWLANRYPLETLYYGRDYGDAIDRVMRADSRVETLPGDRIARTAELLENGMAVAIYSQGMEYGPRALGARSIMASPADAGINDRLNKRLQRTEFMPFAPYVAEEDAEEVFDLGPAKRYAARFMTITCRVRDQWKDRIPAVVHVDGTARPQTIRRDWNPTYYDVLMAFKQRTGLPVLINTSFNVHEEPIINTPEECLRALTDRRIDYVVTDRGLYGLKGGSSGEREP